MTRLRTILIGTALASALVACESRDRTEPSFKPVEPTASAPAPSASPSSLGPSAPSAEAAAPAPAPAPSEPNPVSTGEATPSPQAASPGMPNAPAPYTVPVPVATPSDVMESESLGVPNRSPSTSTSTSTADADRLNRLRRQLASDHALAGVTGYDLSTVDGRVVLNGTVQTEAQHQAILRRSISIVGSRNVQDNLTVSGAGTTTAPPPTNP